MGMCIIILLLKFAFDDVSEYTGGDVLKNRCSGFLFDCSFTHLSLNSVSVRKA